MWRMMQKTLWNHLERVPQLDKMSTVTLVLGRGNNRLGISYCGFREKKPKILGMSKSTWVHVLVKIG